MNKREISQVRSENNENRESGRDRGACSDTYSMHSFFRIGFGSLSDNSLQRHREPKPPEKRNEDTNRANHCQADFVVYTL